MFVSAQWSRTSLFVSLKQVSNPLKGYPLSVDCRTVDLAAVGASTDRNFAASGASRLLVRRVSRLPTVRHPLVSTSLQSGRWTDHVGSDLVDNSMGTGQKVGDAMKLIAIAALFAAGSAAAQDQGTPVTFGGADHCRRRAARQRAGVPQWGESQSGRHCAKAMVKEQVSKTRQSQVPAGAAPRPAVPPAAATQAPLTAVQSGCRPELRALNLCHIQVPAGASAPPWSQPAPRPVAAPVVVTPSPWPGAAPVVVTPSPGPVAAPLVVTPGLAACCSRCAAARGGGTCACARIGPSASGACGYRTATDPARPRAKRARGRDRGKAVGPPAWETPPQGRNPFEEAPSSVLFEVKR
jgi:hypothetical protein